MASLRQATHPDRRYSTWVPSILLFVGFLAAFPRAEGAEIPAPEALAERFARSAVRAAGREGARRVRVDLKGSAGLEGTPALLAIGVALERALYSETGLEAPPAGGDVDLEIVVELQRVRGQVALGGALLRGETVVEYLLASERESPEWWAWLRPRFAVPRDAAGFRWSEAGQVPGQILDADAGDLDGDGRAEYVAVTDRELMAFRVDERGPRLLHSVSLLEGPRPEPAAVASRAPRTFTRVVPGAGAPGEVHVRIGGEAATRVYAWRAGLVRRQDRPSLALATVFRTGGSVESIEGELAPGTNHFDGAPAIRRGRARRTVADVSRWYDVRAADLTAVDLLAEAGPTYGFLEMGGKLRLLKSDLSDVAAVEACGSAFALADWDGDGKADALCSGNQSSDETDTLQLTGTDSALRWSAQVDGMVTAVAAGPSPVGPAALVFVRKEPGAGTGVWLLRGPATQADRDLAGRGAR